MKSNFKQLEAAFKASQKIKKDKIRQEPGKLKRVAMYIWFYTIFP